MTTPSATALTGHLGYWLRFVSNHVSHAFARKVEAHGVTVAEWVVMRLLFDMEAMAPSVIAERMGMTRGAISKLAERLIGKGLVVRAADPRDGRAQRLALTVAGRSLVPTLAALADANDQAFFGHLTPGDRSSLLRMLTDIVARRGLTDIPVD